MDRNLLNEDMHLSFIFCLVVCTVCPHSVSSEPLTFTVDMTPRMSRSSPQLWCVRCLPPSNGVEYLFHKAYEECLRTVGCQLCLPIT